MRNAFYDFSVSPYSYDFATFVVGARSHGCDQVVFVPGEREYQKCSPEEQKSRMRKLLEPIAAHMPKGYVRCRTREEAKAYDTTDCYPAGYSVDKPCQGHLPGYVSANLVHVHPFVPKAEVLERVSKTLGCKLPVTITIRETTIKPGRNSNIEEWMKVGDWLLANGYWPLFVPDTDGRQRFGKFDVYCKAAQDVDERMALYQLSLVNLGINNGPMAFCWWSRIPVLIFRYQDERFPETSAKFHAKNLQPVGSQPRWFSDRQRIIWKPDTAENIIQAFKTWLSVREGKAEWEPHLVPPLPIKAVVKDVERNDQMAVALATANERGWARLPVPKDNPDRAKRMTVVCYGPSLKDEIEAIRNAPRPIITVSGAHNMLLENGIVPDYHMDCDPREEKGMFTAKPHKDVTYLMASCAHPVHWKNLEGHNVMLWHLQNSEESFAWVKKNDPTSFVVGGGSNAGLRAIMLGAILGYGSFDIYGMDCSFVKDETGEVKQWAGPHDGKPQKRLTVHCGQGADRETFVSSGVMIQGAREFIQMCQMNVLELRPHGRGLLQKMYGEFMAGRMDDVKSEDAEASTDAPRAGIPEMLLEQTRKMGIG